MRRITRKYYFSVEGETEKWYLEYLQNIINTTEESKYNVKFDVKIQKNPIARAKGITILGSTEITHVFDMESEEYVHMKQFYNTLDRMIEAQKIGKDIEYKMGYSNFTFELWIILHKIDCDASKTTRKQYLIELNKAYNKTFESLKEYKQEDNFKKILKMISLDDVNAAVKRAKTILKNHKDNGSPLEKYKGYEFYKHNPELSLGEVIGSILQKCELLSV